VALLLPQLQPPQRKRASSFLFFEIFQSVDLLESGAFK
ncbi:unnamed protein product, partial [Acidithrix sp. C25]